MTGKGAFARIPPIARANHDLRAARQTARTYVERPHANIRGSTPRHPRLQEEISCTSANCCRRSLPRSAIAGAAGPSQADINVGVTLSATGPAASLGIPEKNTFELLPTTIGGQKVNWIILDDASDTTKAVTNTKKLISEDKVDVVVGSTITPNSLAMVDVASAAETPMISMAASARIVDPGNPKTRWIFKTPQNDALMADAIAVHMKANGVKTMGYIGFSDAYGDGWLNEITHSAQDRRDQDRRHREVQPHRRVGDGAGAEAHGRQA